MPTVSVPMSLVRLYSPVWTTQIVLHACRWSLLYNAYVHTYIPTALLHICTVHLPCCATCYPLAGWQWLTVKASPLPEVPTSLFSQPRTTHPQPTRESPFTLSVCHSLRWHCTPTRAKTTMGLPSMSGFTWTRTRTTPLTLRCMHGQWEGLHCTWDWSSVHSVLFKEGGEHRGTPYNFTNKMFTLPPFPPEEDVLTTTLAWICHTYIHRTHASSLSVRLVCLRMYVIGWSLVPSCSCACKCSMTCSSTG